MDKRLIIGLIVLVLAAHRIILKRIISNYAKKLDRQSNHYFYNNPDWSEVRQNTIANWRNSGNSRKPRKTKLKSLETLGEDYVFDGDYTEENEFHKSLNEAFQGLDENEINEILDTVLEEKNENDDN